MEVVIRGVVENLTANELEDLGWEKLATQTAHFSYDLAAKSVSPYPPLDPFINSRARSAGSLECKGTSLHERYWNTWQWVRWLHDNGVDVSRPKEGIWRYNFFWVDWESRTYPWVCLSRAMSCQLLISHRGCIWRVNSFHGSLFCTPAPAQQHVRPLLDTDTRGSCAYNFLRSVLHNSQGRSRLPLDEPHPLRGRRSPQCCSPRL